MLSRLQGYYAHLKNINVGVVLIAAVAALVTIGLIILASASQSFRQESRNILNKQVISLVVAIIAFGIGAFVNWERMRIFAIPIGGVVILGLLLVLVPGLGIKVNGAQRWLGLGPIRIQVSELAKFALIFVMADYISSNQRYMRTFLRGFIFPCCIIGVFCILIILEPDFGTTALCASIGFSMLFLAGVRLKFLIPCVFAGAAAFMTAVYFDPVRLKRLTSFMDIEANKLDGAYQLWQGILAFVAGGVHGVGLGEGRQQMSYLPEAHTDFIFPIIGEELGLFFTLGVVGLFLLIFLCGVAILKRSPNIFRFMLVFGSMLCIVVQALINVGVATGLLPTKGISLPFISYGGANLVLVFFLIGVLINSLRSWRSKPIVTASEI